MCVKDQSYRVGTGPTAVLLIHGLCSNPAELRYIANGLARQGYTVYCPELAGHGSGSSGLKNSTWQDWYASAEAALLELTASHSMVLVGGLSTGAVLALMLGARHPTLVKALALYSPTLWLTGWRVPLYAKLFSLVRFRAFASLFTFQPPNRHGIKDDRLRQFLAAALKDSGLAQSTPGEAFLERRRLADATCRALPLITQPVLILHPREDDYAGLDNATYLQANLRGTVDLVVLEDCYHLITVDRQRDVVLARTLAFAAQVTANLLDGSKSSRQVAA
jgi:carboxylesterase